MKTENIGFQYQRSEIPTVNFKNYITLVKSDLYRYTGSKGIGQFVSHFCKNPGFKYTFWMRTAKEFRPHRIFIPIYLFSRLILSRYTYKFGISISQDTKIDSGFYIGHFGGIIVNPNAVIGRNCNISAGVVIGQTNRGVKKGSPVIGDNVFIGPGAKVIGGIEIGDNVAIGANCVVTTNIPDNAVVIGIPGRIVSFAGSEGYINRIDY